MRKTTLSLVLAAALPVAALAANPAQNLVEKLTQGQATIVKSFPGIGNLEGFVVKPTQGQGQETVVFVDKDGLYLIPGPVINANGENATQLAVKQQITDPMAPKVIQAAAKTHWFAQGNPKAPHQAYMLVEPNCIACHMLHQTIQPMIKSGQLYVRWIMVSFLKPSSEGKAAAILSAKDPAKAFNTDEANFNTKTESGSINPLSNVSSEIKNQLKDNMGFMQKYNFISTPVIIYKDKDNKAQIMNGFLPGKAMEKLVDTMTTLN
ncbi:MAG: thiol:disulfide interchange protein DsbG [Gammaproteobacteria bacterium CG11_big_fil_rev_8_21_14_0_20_46_22]|nr:MAG: thiol:disulfide interchange protein DsbG [Gammaproteobacteria bacterium CG12_big_fil_rev_8_21_14_0_65_46_12]PIR11026.1 MAG: thiol:disulfide interchange protein DsbG [Gammaproteobacteria bacterium CG11_big_fil_rev_8_21_14_0_20_46_22]